MQPAGKGNQKLSQLYSDVLLKEICSSKLFHGKMSREHKISNEPQPQRNFRLKMIIAFLALLGVTVGLHGQTVTTSEALYILRHCKTNISESENVPHARKSDELGLPQSQEEQKLGPDSDDDSQQYKLQIVQAQPELGFVRIYSYIFSVKASEGHGSDFYFESTASPSTTTAFPPSICEDSKLLNEGVVWKCSDSSFVVLGALSLLVFHLSFVTNAKKLIANFEGLSSLLFFCAAGTIRASAISNDIPRWHISGNRVALAFKAAAFVLLVISALLSLVASCITSEDEENDHDKGITDLENQKQKTDYKFLRLDKYQEYHRQLEADQKKGDPVSVHSYGARPAPALMKQNQSPDLPE